MFKGLWLTLFTIVPFTVVSCSSSNNISKSTIKSTVSNNASFREKNGISLLSKDSYNKLVDSLAKNRDNIGLAIIYNKSTYIKEVKHESNKSLWYYLKNKLDDITFKIYENSAMGIWLGPFYFNNKSNVLIHGTMNNSNYGMRGYPLIYFDNKYAQLGVSNYKPAAGEIVEITYNHNS